MGLADQNPSNDPLRKVAFEETGEIRDVLGMCAVCRIDQEDVRADKFLLSPQGVAHRQSFDIPENTVCGHDATKDGWWWPR
jgi:hypothetical protein